MSGHATSRPAQGWVHSLTEVDRARPVMADPTPHTTALAAKHEGSMAARAARAWRWAVRQLERRRVQRLAQTPQELRACARSIEQTMPNLAAELRSFADKG